MGVHKVTTDPMETSDDISMKMITSEIKRLTEQKSEIESTMKTIPRVIELKETLMVLKNQAHKIILEKYGKLNYDYEYEKDPEFQETMEKQQAIYNELDEINISNEIDKMKSTLKKLNENLEYVDEKIRMKTEELELMKSDEGEKND